ncbi:hypothetical protein [Metaclostridioides mangenotii]|nr:hypothetical protein [Clostridioides mangenotii]
MDRQNFRPMAYSRLVFNRCMDLDKENRYLRSRLGLNNLTEDDMGEGD